MFSRDKDRDITMCAGSVWTGTGPQLDAGPRDRPESRVIPRERSENCAGFFFRVGLVRLSILTEGLRWPCSVGSVACRIQYSRDFTVCLRRDSATTRRHEMGSITRQTPRDLLAGFPGICRAGRSNHGTPRDGIPQSRDSSGCFSWDLTTTGYNSSSTSLVFQVDLH